MKNKLLVTKKSIGFFHGPSTNRKRWVLCFGPEHLVLVCPYGIFGVNRHCVFFTVFQDEKRNVKMDYPTTSRVLAEIVQAQQHINNVITIIQTGRPRTYEDGSTIDRLALIQNLLRNAEKKIYEEAVRANTPEG